MILRHVLNTAENMSLRTCLKSDMFLQLTCKKKPICFSDVV
jgi:hypothetical protein